MDKKHKEKIKNSVKKNWKKIKNSPAYDSRCKNMAKSKIGKLSPNKGRKYPTLIGNTNGFKKGNKPWNKGLGNKSLSQRIRSSLKYIQWRSDVFQRDKWICQTCGNRGCILEAHHKKRLSYLIKLFNITTLEQALNCVELWDRKNGVTLCDICHDLTKRKTNENK